MGEPGFQLRQACQSAISQLDQHLTKVHGAERLSGNALTARFGKFQAGWKLILQADGEQFELAILTSAAFPFDPPQLQFTNTSCFLRFPHVDDKGKLCLANAAVTYSPRLVTQTADYLISEARRLIGDSLTGRNENDFALEFQSYWRCLPNFSPKRFWSLLRPTPPTRVISYYAATGFSLFAESTEEMRPWLKKFNGGSLPKGYYPKTTALIWLAAPLFPKDYPKTARDVLALARGSGNESDRLLQSTIPLEPGALPVILGFDTDAGPILVGVELSEPKAGNRANPTKQQNSRNFGFRPHHVPAGILLNRYFGDGKLALMDVMRADASWCLRRGGIGYDQRLFSKTVVIVGCGSLGADVALMLAKSGVGRFVLIDNDVLKWGNVARHALGGDFVGQAKASALATSLERQMPWLELAYESLTLETLIYERPKVLQESDLVVSTAGDWICDCVLNVARKTFARFPPVIFGWTEAYGIAGHALAVLDQGGCLGCGMSEFGVFAERVTEWTDGQVPLLQATGCGDIYQPYGAIDVAPIKAVIAELALDVLRRRHQESTLHTWIGDLTRLGAHGGRLCSRWGQQVVPGSTDRRVVVQAWSTNPECPLCN